MNVLFLGNHDVGITALSALLQIGTVEVVGVVAHPYDPEDGVAYKSLFEYAVSRGLKVIRGKPSDILVLDFISSIEIDLIWITDYKFIIPLSIFSKSPMGAVNLHPSLLPKYRGRAPINWAIINGETRLGLTAHFIDDGVDTGDIITQSSFHFPRSCDVADALDMLMPLYFSLTIQVIDLFATNNISRVRQGTDGIPPFPARKPSDGLILWNSSSNDIYNFIRALTKPYPGAFAFINSHKIFIWSSSLLSDSFEKLPTPGTIVRVNSDNSFVVACVDGFINIEKWSCDSIDDVGSISAGVILS